mgnify:CR=1
MVRIVISSKEVTGLQQAQFDLVDGSKLADSFLVGDYIDAPVFENLGPIQVVFRSHHQGEDGCLLIIYCEGSHFLQRFFVDTYPDIECMPDSAQLPPQNWKCP